MRWGVFLLFLVGCAASETVVCGDITCPAQTTCTNVSGKNYCATDDQLNACKSVEENGACTTMIISAGVCHGGVCFAAGCGNGLVEPLEQCDDGNQITGDGCSGDCTSDETCGNGVTDPLAGEQCDDGDLQSNDGCDSSCLPEQPRWSSIGSELIYKSVGVPRTDAAMAYDEARGLVVLFGGIDANGTRLDDTWLWNGRGGAKADPANRPSRRGGASMVYDGTRQRIVLFGGETDSGVVSDTWEWDGSTWTSRATSDQPAPCKWAGMAYDAHMKRVTLFFGYNGGPAPQGTNYPDGYVEGEIWTWDGTTWTLRNSIAPTAANEWPKMRERTTVSYDPKRGKIVIYGGVGPIDDQFLNWGNLPETWEYDGTPAPNGYIDGSWSKPSTTPPSVSANVIVDRFALAWDPVTQKTVLVGGIDQNGVPHNYSFSWNGSSWNRLADASAARTLHTAAADTSRGRIVTWGGESGLVTEEWNGTAWSDVSPAPQQYVGPIAVDTSRGRAVMFDSQGTTWEFDGLGWQSATPAASPPPRPDAALAYDAKNKVVVLFGGGDPSTDHADTWVYNGTTWQQKVVSGPSGRRGASMVYDAKRQEVVLFGGVNTGKTQLADTWIWNGMSWSPRTPATSPGERGYAGIAYDPDLEQVVMFAGGYFDATGGSFDRNLFLWDGTNWAMGPYEPMKPLPTARVAPAMTWDPLIHSVVMFGGRASSIFQDTWVWNGTGWDGTKFANGGWALLGTNQLPPNRYGAALFVDPRGKALTLFGGHSAIGDYGDTWQLKWRSTALEETCRDAVADLDGDGLKSCADPDCWAICAPDCPPGTSCTAPGCGDGTCNTALETHLLCPQDCVSAQSVCGDFRCDSGESCAGDCP